MPLSRAASTQRKSGTTRARRARGEQTRLKILDAVLKVIAREGTRGVTHRSVAAEAGVQLSLTTYYFSDIGALIREALARDPDSVRLLDQLRRTYAHRLALAQRVAYT